MRGPFQNSAFRRLFTGRIVTNVGDSFYFIAAMWLVYNLTGSAVYSGIAGFLTQAPSAFQFLAGPLVDRWSIRRTLTGTQLVQGLVVAIIPVVHVAGLLTVEVILVVMPLLAALNQLVYPAQSAALPRLLDNEDLVAANSAFSIAYQGMDMVANGVGGVLIGILGAIALFAIDAITFGIAALLFATVAVPAPNERPDDEASSGTTDTAEDGSPDGTTNTSDRPVATDGGNDGDIADTADSEPATDELKSSYLDQLRSGIGFVQGTFLVWLVGGAAVANFASGMVLATLPAYADTLGMPAILSIIGDAGVYGVLMMAFAAGNLLGALTGSRLDDRPFGRTMMAAFASAGLLWTGALAADWLPATALLIVSAAVPVGAVNVQLAAITQSAPPDSYVGRVSSVLGSATSVSVPIGSLVGGIVATATTPRTAMLGFGITSVGLAIYVFALPGLRRLPAPSKVELGSKPG